MWYAYFMKALVYKGNGIIQKEQRPFPVIKRCNSKSNNFFYMHK